MPSTKVKQVLTIKQDWLTMFFSQVIDYGAKVTSSRKLDFSNLKNPLKNFPQEKFKNIFSFARILKKPAVLIALITIALLGSGVYFLKSKVASSTPQIFGSSQTNFSPATSIAVNRKFDIPIRNSGGKTTGSVLPVTITTVDSSKKILISGKPATSRDGKLFLILNLDIDNSTTNQLNIRPVDFIRLQDSEGKSFAPDVHNDVVKAEPISIKKTRVGFVVDEVQKQFKFLIGEIGGSTQTLEITM